MVQAAWCSCKSDDGLRCLKTPWFVVPEPMSCGDQNQNQFRKRSALGHGPRAMSHACWRKLVHPVDFHGYSLNDRCFAGSPFTFEAPTPERLALFCSPKHRQKFTQDLDIGCNRKAWHGRWTRRFQQSLPASPVFRASRWGEAVLLPEGLVRHTAEVLLPPGPMVRSAAQTGG